MHRRRAEDAPDLPGMRAFGAAQKPSATQVNSAIRIDSHRRSSIIGLRAPATGEFRLARTHPDSSQAHVSFSVPISVPKLGPRAIIRQPTPTSSNKNGPKIDDFRPVL